MRVCLATSERLEEPDPDEKPLLRAFREAGHEAESVPWDGEGGEPAGLDRFDAVCLRATWNYAKHLDAFLEWVGGASRATTLLNPERVVRWNIHKTYLRDLQSRGAAIVPTAFVERNGSADVAAVARDRGWDSVIVKPTVGAASLLVKQFGEDELDKAQEYLDKHVRERDMMIQRYLPSVEREESAEMSVVMIGGEISHGVRKKPRYDDEDESVERTEPGAEERRFAERTVAAAREAMGGVEMVCARVDVMRGEDGEILLGELELVEPSLWFDVREGSAARYVRAVERLAAKRG